MNSISATLLLLLPLLRCHTLASASHQVQPKHEGRGCNDIVCRNHFRQSSIHRGHALSPLTLIDSTIVVTRDFPENARLSFLGSELSEIERSISG